MMMTLSLFMNGPLGLAFLALPIALAAGPLVEGPPGAVQLTLRAGTSWGG